ncbi:MAG TPA: Spy/CpxP family protein refolding chaperone [Pyrinomonadaceae bacterium]|nr:Spy/CpxP family protein refolding chaperone [Pyrinomonadaceae bacterium]
MRTSARKSPVAIMCGFVFVLLIVSAQVARAQEASPTQAQQQDSTAAQINPNDPATILSHLNLSPEQVTQMRSIQSESVPQAQQLNRQLNQARRALDEAIYSDNVDEALIEQRARDVAEAQAALVRFRAQTELRVRRILTPEQLQTFRNLRQEAMRERRIERRLERQANPRRQGNALDNQNRQNNQNRAVQRPNAQTPRERRRNLLGQP